MASLILRVMVAAAAVFLIVPNAGVDAVWARTPIRELALARNYVFASCLIQRYPNTPIAAEANEWASEFVENGSLEVATYRHLADIARTSAPEPLFSFSGRPMLLASCIELYNNPALAGQLQAAMAKRY